MQEKSLATNYGIFTTLVVTIVGVGAFSFPRGVAKDVGSDGWIVVLLSGIICFVFAYAMYKSTVFNNYKDINNILEDSFGHVVGVILALIFAAFIVFYIGLSTRVFIEVVKIYLLEKTPTEFLILITILTGTYLIRGEFDALLKFNEISFWVMFVSIAVVLLFTLNKTDFSNMLPVFNKPVGVYMSSIKYTMFSFTGFEVIYMLMPHAKNRDKLGKTLLMSITFVTIFYSIIYILVIAVFNKNEASVLIWPTITMIKSIDIPGSFVERWEGVVMTLWIIFYFTTFTNVYYFSSDMVKKALRLSDIRISLVLIIPFLYLVAMYPENIAMVYDLLKYAVPPTGVVVYVVLPLLLLIIGIRRRKGDGSGSVV